jgi:ABC-type lipoprotein release transport system permease subunit
MALPLSYSIRNLRRRRLTTILTVAGMALVVLVFAAVLMMAAGLQKTLVETGSPSNVVVVRKGSQSEVMSAIDREKAAILEMLPQVAAGTGGRPMMAREVVVLIALKKQGEEKSSSHSNVIVRGIQSPSLSLRHQVKLAAGRLPRPNSSEVLVGNSIVSRVWAFSRP